ncbi:hypothetical protein KKA23_03580 [Patescibacteria group bacterium]|nr:hypothetical protein [Patescibacteria group bacterium]MBU3923031.1 hypothetical protein [Patescibacteria group bacterium]
MEESKEKMPKQELPEVSKAEIEKSRDITLLLKFGRHAKHEEDKVIPEEFEKLREIGGKLEFSAKAYTSFKKRAIETGEKITEATSENLKTRTRLELSPRFRSYPELMQTMKEEGYEMFFEEVLNNRPEVRADVASGIATRIEHYRKLAKRLKSGSKYGLVNVSHDLDLACFLKECLVRETKEGEIKGFEDIKEIGGPFDAAEFFELKLNLDEESKEELSFKFDNPERLSDVKCKLDIKRVEELAQLFKEKYRKK